MLRAIPRLLVAAAAVLAICACSPSPGPKPPPPASGADAGGALPVPVSEWKPRSFARATEGCTQTWLCDCTAVAARTGCHADASSDTTTQGACASDSGPVNGCTRCMALPPATVCACGAGCP